MKLINKIIFSSVSSALVGVAIYLLVYFSSEISKLYENFNISAGYRRIFADYFTACWFVVIFASLCIVAIILLNAFMWKKVKRTE